MRASLLMLLLSLSGCGGSDEAPDAGPPPPPPIVVEPPPPPPPPEPTVVTQGQYYAVFLGDDLDRCIERTRRWEIPADVTWAPSDFAPIDPVPEGRVIELTSDCNASFEGRTVLATCEGSWDLTRYEGADAGIGSTPPGVTMMETYATRNYRFETTLETDSRLGECLADQRRWTAVADDSVEYVRARAQAHERARSHTR